MFIFINNKICVCPDDIGNFHVHNPTVIDTQFQLFSFLANLLCLVKKKDQYIWVDRAVILATFHDHFISFTFILRAIYIIIYIAFNIH